MNNEREPSEVQLTDWSGAPSDEDLAELLSFMRGDCRWGWMGKYLTTHPQDADDENQQRIHAAMLVLEKRGDVIRHFVSAVGCVTWAPNVAANLPPQAVQATEWLGHDGVSKREEMNKCTDCKHALWKRTAAGKLHPSGDGQCKYPWKMPEIPVAMFWVVHPTLNGGLINRKQENAKNCVYWARSS